MDSDPSISLPENLNQLEKKELEEALGINQEEIDATPGSVSAAILGFVEEHSEQHVQITSGPLPPAKELEAYERICPGAADRIIKMAERQSAHRQNMEIKMLDSVIDNAQIDSQNEYKLGRLGSVFAFIICAMIVSIGGICLYCGQNIAGFAALIGGLASIAGVFMYTKRKSSRSTKGEENDSKEIRKTDNKNE